MLQEPMMEKLLAMRLHGMAGAWDELTTQEGKPSDVGTQTSRWLIEQRVIAAQELLESTRLSVEEVATRVGFGSSDLLRKHFGRVVSTSPSRYRESFQRSPAR